MSDVSALSSALSPIELTLPMPPNLTNSGRGRSRHWRSAHREKTAYWAQLDLLLAAKQIPRPPAAPLTKATLRSVMYLGGAMDDENAAARHKIAIDWLKKRRFIVDDRRKNLRWEAFPEQVIRRDGNYRLVLTLTPIEERIDGADAE